MLTAGLSETLTRALCLNAAAPNCFDMFSGSVVAGSQAGGLGLILVRMSKHDQR